MRDEFRRLALFSSGVAELTRHRAEQIVRDMVQSGDVRRDQASSLVKTVLDSSRQNRKDFVGIIRTEIANQVANLGLARQRDVERLERRVARLEDRLKAERAKSTSASSKKTTVRKKTTTEG